MPGSKSFAGFTVLSPLVREGALYRRQGQKYVARDQIFVSRFVDAMWRSRTAITHARACARVMGVF